jgi:hypothetical protein
MMTHHDDRNEKAAYKHARSEYTEVSYAERSKHPILYSQHQIPWLKPCHGHDCKSGPADIGMVVCLQLGLS